MAVDAIDLSALYYAVDIPDKALGVWQIPQHDIIVPVYSWRLNPGNPQAITDADNSACEQPYCNAVIISDHAGSISSNGKGRWEMDKVTLDTQAFYRKRGLTVAYRCYALYRAEWHSWGYTINSVLITPRSSKDILCASCVDRSGKEAYVAVFKEIGRI